MCWVSNYKQSIVNYCQQFETQKPIAAQCTKVVEISIIFQYPQHEKWIPHSGYGFCTVRVKVREQRVIVRSTICLESQQNNKIFARVDFLVFTTADNSFEFRSESTGHGNIQNFFSAESKCFPEQSCQHYVLSCEVSERGRFSNTWVF